MRHFAGILIALTLVLGACTEKYETTEIIIENVTVQFQTKSVITVQENYFRSTGEYEHVYPTSYKAYFVSKENKGGYTSGQLVKTLTVGAGNNTITVPKLDYVVYVTNYEKEGAWYTWTDALNQLPRGSYELFLFGKNDIDYSTQLAGEVTVENPYSAIMINTLNLDPARTPKEYDSGMNYQKVNDDWWLLYVRNRHNSQVWVPNSIINGGSGNTAYGFSADVEANKIYRYTINASVGETEGNFSVVVEDWTETIDEQIDIFD